MVFCSAHHSHSKRSGYCITCILISPSSSYKLLIISDIFKLKMTKIKTTTCVLLSLMKSVKLVLLLWLLTGINNQISNKTSSILVSATDQPQQKEETSFAFINNELLEQNERLTCIFRHKILWIKTWFKIDPYSFCIVMSCWIQWASSSTAANHQSPWVYQQMKKK